MDLTSIIGFDWDEGNARKNEKLRVTQSEAEEVFFNQPLVVLDDHRHRNAEPRYHALGETGEGRKLHLTFTLRGGGTLIRVISARPMHRKEKAIHEQSSQRGTILQDRS